MRHLTTSYSLAVLAVLISLAVGCRSRAQYVNQADRDVFCLLDEKTESKPWATPPEFSIIPPDYSRLSDPGCQVCPTLPVPTPSLYAYQIPKLRSSLSDAEASPALVSGPNQESENVVGTPIPPRAWIDIPNECLKRMLDFDSVREEARYTEEEFPDATLPSPSAETNQLTLHDIVDLALINSREYQTQKETLYQVALRLSLERFDYQTQFDPRGNGTALNSTWDRNGGISESRLSIPSRIGIQRMLVTGGDLMASFANNVLLTFNGPSGFTADVSSNLLIEFAQPLLQVDIRFESLTQAERNVVYAARDFARFRKQFFIDFAREYYGLILDFRQVEIDSQNYFSLVRAFNQAEAEYQAGLVPRFQVDQVEQSLLTGRAGLIRTCNGLERSLDSLKLSMGIPTETPININLKELNELTRLDQLSVTADSTSRVLKRLQKAIQIPDRAELVSTAAVLLDRLIEASEINDQDGEPSQATLDFQRARARFLTDYSRLASQQILSDLELEIRSASPSVPVIFQRSQSHGEALLDLVDLQLEVARLTKNDDDASRAAIERFNQTRLELERSVQGMRGELQMLIQEERLEGLPNLVQSSNVLRQSLSELVANVDRFNGFTVEPDDQEDLKRIVADVKQVMATSTSILDSSEFGLKPVDIDMDDAMITALVLRFDIMNQRGAVADDWRQIKLAADELKSVIDLNASQRFDTPPGVNQPFNFSLNDSTATLRLSVDAPLNRFAERNAFRNTLINYQRAMRNLTQLEDTIKFSVRNDLRNLAFDREQYLIGVASAALAYERVVSTSLEFRLGTGGVTARDFLEAQQAYTRSLRDVAGQHITYILDRAQLFFDLELLTVDQNGFWEEINVESFQPQPYFEIPTWAQPVYGELPDVCYSEEIEQMLCIPPGVPQIFRETPSAPNIPAPAASTSLEQATIPPDSEN